MSPRWREWLCRHQALAVTVGSLLGVGLAYGLNELGGYLVNQGLISDMVVVDIMVPALSVLGITASSFAVGIALGRSGLPVSGALKGLKYAPLVVVVVLAVISMLDSMREERNSVFDRPAEAGITAAVSCLGLIVLQVIGWGLAALVTRRQLRCGKWEITPVVEAAVAKPFLRQWIFVDESALAGGKRVMMRKAFLVLGILIALFGGYLLATTYLAWGQLREAAEKSAKMLRMDSDRYGSAPLADLGVTQDIREVIVAARLAARTTMVMSWAAGTAVKHFRGIGIASVVIGVLVVLLNVRSMRAGTALSVCLVASWLGGAVILVPRANAAVSKETCVESIRFLAKDLVPVLEDRRECANLADGWCDLLAARTGMRKGGAFFVCPELPGAECAWGFNRNLLSMRNIKQESTPNTVLLFETDGGWNVVGGPEAVMKRPRHGGEIAVWFVDGHGEFVPLSDINKLEWKPGNVR